MCDAVPVLVSAGFRRILSLPACACALRMDHLGPLQRRAYVTCRQTHCPALVHFDATHAAFTGIFSKEKLRLAACTLWPQHLGCAQQCMGEAARFRSARPPEEARAVEPGMHCLTVSAATAAYWRIHALWYSHYPFRAQWMQLMGYSEAQVRQMVLLSVPQLVTVVWSLSFYGPAWPDHRAHPPARSHKRCPDRFSRLVSHLGGNGRDHPVPGRADRSDLGYTDLPP